MASRWSCWCLCVLLMDAVASAFPYLLPGDAGAELGVRHAELLSRLRAEDWPATSTTTTTTSTTPRTRHRRKKERASRRQRRNSVDPVFTVPAAGDVRRLALCRYRVSNNVYDAGGASELRRVPASFPEMTCERQGCSCAEQGDFRCTQLVSQLEVAYLNRTTGRLQRTEVVDVNAGCVCSTRRAQIVPLQTPKPPLHLLPDGKKSKFKKLLVSKNKVRLVPSS